MPNELESTEQIEEGVKHTQQSRSAYRTLYDLLNRRPTTTLTFVLDSVFLLLSHRGENDFRFHLRKSVPGRYLSSHRGEERPREQGIQSVGVTCETGREKIKKAHCFLCALRLTERLQEATPSPSQGT